MYGVGGRGNASVERRERRTIAAASMNDVNRCGRDVDNPKNNFAGCESPVNATSTGAVSQ
jgi:hypothetical protein